ncbi:hypothetical protein HYC85_013619 [Camellia sinensis]|uniref:K-box domain-containing protein n=1 Tax=Camellia sinensis TaxID=4442 RepID=A0A7J7H3U5_CAMSI|nr:hypothetical protein HYC85_013619 [Camellia sinensis]
MAFVLLCFNIAVIADSSGSARDFIRALLASRSLRGAFLGGNKGIVGDTVLSVGVAAGVFFCRQWVYSAVSGVPGGGCCSRGVFCRCIRQWVVFPAVAMVSPRQSMQKTIERYGEHVKMVQTNNPNEEQFTQQLEHEATIMSQKIKIIEAHQRKFLGQDLASCSVEELREIGSQLEQSLRSVRARKELLFKEQIDRLKEKCAEKPWQLQPAKEKEVAMSSRSSLSSEMVETELFIGLPLMRCS